MQWFEPGGGSLAELTSKTHTSAIHVPLWIGGRRVETPEWLGVTDPAVPRRVVGYAAAASLEHSKAAVTAAYEAWKSWSALEPERRSEQLLAALERLNVERRERLELLVGENGKVLAEAEVELSVFTARARLAVELAPELSFARHLPRLQGRPQAALEPTAKHTRVAPAPASAFRSRISPLPLGVVTIIVPYNWPLAILAASLPYALVAGCTVIVKPPPTAPLSLGRTLELLAAALPPGVVNVVSGTHEAVAPLIQDPRVARIVFTGSTAGGKAMMRMAAENLARVTLELGGNDPAIILGDARLDGPALRRLVAASFTTAGQVCMGIKRLYVERSRYAEVVDGIGQILSTFRVGHGLSPSTTMGPLNGAAQRDFVAGLCAEARAAGHEVRAYGELDDPEGKDGGYFLRPSLVLDPDPGARIVAEEQFGPALPILPFDDVGPLIEQVNEEWSGLCSSIWTEDMDRAAALAGRLRTGTTWINDANAVAQDDRAPFGGFRQSGIGRELGTEGLMEFTEAHTVTYPA